MKEKLLAVDRWVVLTCHKITQENALIRQSVIGINRWVTKVFYVLYGGMLVYLLFMDRVLFMPYFAGPFLAYVISRAIRLGYRRARPFESLDYTSHFPHSNDPSFPSMHAMSAFVIGFATFQVNGFLGGLVLLLAVLTATSRVLAGVHYPSDVLGGAGIGLMSGWVVFSIL
jgi:undecaprenyl-diphosphatase